MTEHTSTEPLEAPIEATAPAPGWGAPVWGAAPRTAEMTTVDDDEPFVPAPRYRMGRFTKILICVCLVLAGALGGAAIQKAVDTRTGATNRANFSQLAPGAGTGQNGAGTGQNGTGGFGRNRASQGAGGGAGTGGN